jgi:chitinase
LFQVGKVIPGAYASYSAIEANMLGEGQGFTRYWDDAAKAPYLYNADKHIFVSYEDEQSLTGKCKYVREHKLGGVMFWDYFGDPSETLLKTVGVELGQSTKNRRADQPKPAHESPKRNSHELSR